MSAPNRELRRRVIELNDAGVRPGDIARELHVSRTRVRQVLEATAPERTHERFLQRASTIEQLRHHERLLIRRITTIRRQLRATRDEIAAREVDEALGLTVSRRDRGASMAPCTTPRP